MSNDRLSALAAALRRFWYPECCVCGQHKPGWVAYSTTCGDCMLRLVTNPEASAAPPPAPSVHNDERETPLTQTLIKPRAVIVDIDGTVATHANPDSTLLRGHYDFHRVGEDLPNQPVIDTVLALRNAGHEIVFCSGRPALIYPSGVDVQAETRIWLSRHLGSWTDQALLLMRGAHDGRHDSIVKHELYANHIAPIFDVRLALDDRDSVVKLWRGLGITTLQVDYGDF